MKATELRIGNYLYDYEGKIAIEVSAVEIYQVDFENNPIYRPIPITEEWLIRLGFKDGTITTEEFDLRYEMETGILRIIIDESDCCTATVPNDIKYIHQLQNLYYALTGNELMRK